MERHHSLMGVLPGIMNALELNCSIEKLQGAIKKAVLTTELIE